jgi:PKD repeat protein
MKGFALFFLMLAAAGQTLAQQWVDAKRDGQNIYEAIELFELEMEGVEYEKGRGIKQFERWRNFWEPRLFPTGDFSEAKSDYFKQQLNQKSSANATKDGADWQSLGLDTWTTNSYGPGNGRINCIHPDPSNPEIIYVGTPAGGLWRSSDAGINWEPLTDHLPTLGVSAIQVDHSNGDIIYIATGDSDNTDTYGIGVLKSTDGGDSWSSTGLAWDIQENNRSHRMMMHPDDSNILLAATSAGLFKTTDAGLTWIKVLSGLVYDIEFKPGDPSIVYACKDRFYKSEDGGDSFTPVNGQLPNSSQVDRMAIAVTDAEPGYVYCLVADDVFSAFMGLWRSSDSGDNWELRSDSPNVLTSNENGTGFGGQAWYDLELAVSQTDADRVITGGVNLWESSNGGQNWSINSHWYFEPGMNPNYVHADIHHLEFEGDQLFCGSDGGIFVSEDSGDSFDDLSAGLEISQFYRFDVHDGDGSLVIAGAQDNGTNLLEGGSWTHVLGADGMKCLIDPDDAQTLYACIQYGDIYKSTNGGASFDWSSSGITEDGAWTTPYIMSPVNNDVLIAGYENVWRSNDGADTWSPISTTINQQLRSVAMGMTSPNTIYAASYTDIFRTTNGGSDWDNVSIGLPGAAITSILVHPFDAQLVWVTFSGFSEGEKVYQTLDGGDSWMNVSDNLPNIPVNCIALDSSNDDGLYVGTDGGIFYTDNDLAHWEPFNEGLPNVIVNEIEVHSSSESVYAATFGRGIWQSPLWTPSEETPVVDFDWFPFYICEGESVQFTDLSTGNTANWNWSFAGGNTTTSTEANPIITYDDEGSFDFSLTVENMNGESSADCSGCVIVLPVEGELSPFIEGFEDATELSELNWFTGSQNAVSGWEMTDIASTSGTQSVYINNHSIDFANDFELFSVPIDFANVPEEETAFLSFKYAYCQMSPNNDDRLRLFISEDCSQTWSLRKQWSGLDDLQTATLRTEEFIPNEDEWIEELFEIPSGDLSATTSFRFTFQNDNGNNIFIDDINIWSAEVSVQEEEELVVDIIPNPFSEQFQVRTSSACQWEVFDMTGRLIDNGQSVTRAFDINSSDWTAGTYAIKIQTGNGTTVKSLTKQ